jgi:hypothetical protein
MLAYINSVGFWDRTHPRPPPKREGRRYGSNRSKPAAHPDAGARSSGLPALSLFGCLSTSNAACPAAKRFAASASPGLTSGWHSFARLRHAFFVASKSASGSRSRISSARISSALPAAIARPAPRIMLRARIAVRAARLFGRARCGILGAQPFEIVPAAIIFGGVGFAEIPAFGTVRRLGCGAVSGFGTAMAIAEAYLLRLARRAIGAPAGKTPIIGSLGAAHRPHVAAGARDC